MGVQMNMKNKMSGNIKVISKTVPIQVVPAKNDLDPVARGRKIILQLRHIIHFESSIGINRLYLLYHRRLVLWLNHLFSVFFMSIAVYCVLRNRSELTATYMVIVNTTCVEYLCLVIISMLAKKSSFRNFFEDLAHFDSLLNLNGDLKITSPSGRGLAWIVASVLYSICEFFSLSTYMIQKIDYSFMLTYITLVAHDCEQILFCSVLRMILIRVRILKAHVLKTLVPKNSREAKKKLLEVEALSYRAQLDIGTLHRNYELLHKCAEQLNSIMSLPMMLMLFCSGLSTTMLLRQLFRVLQSTTFESGMGSGLIAYVLSRCLRYTLLVVMPCLISSTTTTQVACIRTTLHDAMNQFDIDKADRRRVKAFFQLTKENEFAYALWGLIRLNMSLPLSYLSLCTTYLVIIIQFSKFID
ncbi:uncharacterized protein LOC135076705 [Ostrinia nubilalis]|uniref:uncharacterized protein LOC135076705 n=1 Tax=Ostrinia nubilalis TaxID=29057 RepID=UPI0030825326